MSDLAYRLTAVLFVATEPVGADQLAQTLGQPATTIISALHEVELQLKDMPVRLTIHDGRYRLVTAPDVSDDIKAFLQAEAKTELSRAALETLAIVAYRGPLTRSAIEAIRGVSSETMLRNLLQRDLIIEHGPAKEPGRPMTYAVSQSFLQQAGLSRLTDLPPLPEQPTDAA